MSRSSVSRRVREFVGVALFGAAIIWIIALVSYEPADPVWFFSTGGPAGPVNFAGRIGAFLAELSFQSFGYASYLIPAVLIVIGWQSFWCREVDAAGTKAAGAALLFSCISAFLSLVFGTLDVAGKPFRAGGFTGDWLAGWLSEYFNRTGSVVLLLTLIVLGDHPVHPVLVRPVLRRALRHHRQRRGAVAGLLPRMARGSAPRETASRGDRETHEKGRRPARDQDAGTGRRPGGQGRQKARAFHRAP